MAKPKVAEATRSISQKTKRRVQKVEPNDMRCLIENCPQNRAVEFCHVVPGSLSDESQIMDSIEWFWNMRNKTLTLNDCRNVFLAGASFHVMHVQDLWALLPPQDIVAQYMSSLVQVGSQKVAKREAFPDIPNGAYNYRFLPLRDMQNIGITRQTEFPPTRNGFTTHMYPFKTMPDLCSHIHPKFAILELGRKLSEMPPEVARRHLEASQLLDDIFVLFRAWTSRLPSKAWDDVSYAPSSVDDDEEDGSNMDDVHKDANRRVRAPPQGEARKRSAPADLTTPPANRPRGEEVVPSTLLDKRNYELNEEELAELNKKAEPQRFHYWLAKMFVSEPDGEISPIDFWVKYKDTYADKHLVPLASDILPKVTDIFPRARVMDLRDDTTTRFIVRGIAQRKL